VLSGFFFQTTCLTAFMWAPDELAKWLVLSFGLLPASVFLSIGRVLSPERRWKREVGIVLIASAGAGTLAVLTMALMFKNPAMPEHLATIQTEFGVDYVSGISWIVLLGLLGVLLLRAARKQHGSAQRGPRVPIIGR
ncbi:MAG: hypothetical protein L0Z07_04620, partial [Planctomycetes bacterium]|nr:hypothetical protein [Planctomycetota bacterium]